MKKRPAKKNATTPTSKRKYSTRKATVDQPTNRKVVSDAESTIKFAIFDGITDQWNKRQEPNFVQLVRDKVFERIFSPEMRWAVEEHLQALK